MKRIFSSGCIVAIVLFCSQELQAQSENASVDSLQRVMMRDSLNVSDTVISQVFSVRENFLSQVNQINEDSTLTEAQKSSARQSLISQTNNSIRTLLGQTAYDHYTEMIRRKISSRAKHNNIQPLASQNQ